MFKHQHPYKPFLFTGVKKLIVGTLPPPRFTTKDYKPRDVDFCYGSQDGQLWPILDRLFDLNLEYGQTSKAVETRKRFLLENKIGICDIVEYAYRQKIDASDLGMQQVVLRDIVKILIDYPSLYLIIFTGGNSKNGPEYFFRKQLKEKGLKIKVLDSNVPRIHSVDLDQPNPTRTVYTVSLTAPSGAANMAVGSLPLYRKMKNENPNFNTLDFRVLQYGSFFKETTSNLIKQFKMVIHKADQGF